MLINLSNHPSSIWSQKQVEATHFAYGKVKDMPFPHVDPTATLDEVSMLVDRYISDIKKMPPATIHVMGELTFVHIFVRKCEEIGIQCVAATTNRQVEEINGKKIATFDFVLYRPYF